MSEKQRVIAFHYVLKNSQGEVLDSSDKDEPLAILEGAGQIINGLERELCKLKSGEKKHVNLKAEEAYGKHNPEMVMEVPLEKIPAKDVKPGDRFRSSKDHHSPMLVVTKVTDKHATLDANHPLAGQDLSFDVEIAEIREATPEEIAHGHVHGPGGHHH
jgi:FKBP-type peptidyl-prolyl cis-trans isomerase SlyD